MKNKKIFSFILVIVMVFTTLLSTTGIALAATGEGTIDSPYLISTAQELYKIPSGTTAHYKLTSDIDLQNVKKESIGVFSGVLDGNGHTINNLDIVGSTSAGYTGLFSQLSNATIKNLIIDSAKVTSGGNYIGVLAGYSVDSSVVNCQIINSIIAGNNTTGALIGYTYTGTIISDCISKNNIITGSSSIGGLIGQAYNSNVTNCSSIGGKINTSSSHTGGLIGYLDSSNLLQCYSSTDVISSSTYVGGLVGTCNRNNKITQCYANNQVKGLTYIGGLLGYQNPSNTSCNITDSYSLSALISTDANGIAGGIAGNKVTSIINCYFANEITAKTKYVLAETSSITNSYFDETLTSITTPASQARSTELMYKMLTYTGWDFDEVWSIQDGKGYPTLKFATEDNTEEPEEPENPEEPEAPEPQEVSLELVLGLNEALLLSLQDEPEDTASLTWSSSNDAIVSADANGEIKALSLGEVIISVMDEDGELIDSVAVSVVKSVKNLRITVNLTPGKSCKLNIKNIKNQDDITWSIMDDSVATVSSKGKVKAVANGLTVVTAVDKNNATIGQIYVKVK